MTEDKQKEATLLVPVLEAGVGDREGSEAAHTDACPVRSDSPEGTRSLPLWAFAFPCPCLLFSLEPSIPCGSAYQTPTHFSRYNSNLSSLRLLPLEQCTLLLGSLSLLRILVLRIYGVFSSPQVCLFVFEIKQGHGVEQVERQVEGPGKHSVTIPDIMSFQRAVHTRFPPGPQYLGL